MRTKGKGKRRFAIVIAMILALQCTVFSTQAFAATDPDTPLTVHVTNAYWAVKAKDANGQATPFEATVQTLNKGAGKLTTGYNSFVGGKNMKSTANGVTYTFLNVFALNEAGGGPIYWSSADQGDTVKKIANSTKGVKTITMTSGEVRELTEDEIYISPVYSVKASWRLQFNAIDNVSTGSSSWYNTTGNTSSYTKTFKDPSKATPKEHYQFVTWKNFETGNTYGAGEKYTYSPKDQDFLNDYYYNNGCLYEDEVNIYAVWQPSVTVNWHDESGNIVKSEEEFDKNIAAADYMAADLTGESGETYTFEGWMTANGTMATDEVYTLPETTIDPVDQKVIDLYPVYHTEKSVAKIWSDEENRDGLRAESIEVELRANGEAIDTATLSEDNGWAYTWEDLTALHDGEAIVYTVDEISDVEGYEKDVQFTSLKDIITNTHAAEKINVNVTKVWEDNNDELNVRPMLIEVKLMANGEESQSLILGPANEDENGNWTGSFEDLYKYENGEKIDYTIEETAIDDYESSIEGNAEDGFVITNSCTKEPPQPIIPDDDPADDNTPAAPADEDNTPAAPADEDNTPAAPADEDNTPAAPADKDNTPAAPADKDNDNKVISGIVEEDNTPAAPAAPANGNSQNATAVTSSQAAGTAAQTADNAAADNTAADNAAQIAEESAPAAASTANAPAARDNAVEITESAAPAAASIEDEAAPQAAGTGYWALINLLLTIGAALMSLLLMITHFTRRDREDEENGEESEIKRHGLARILSLVPAVAAIVVFLLTENMANPMRLVDDWTLLMAVFFAANLVLAVLSKKTRDEEEQEVPQTV